MVYPGAPALDECPLLFSSACSEKESEPGNNCYANFYRLYAFQCRQTSNVIQRNVVLPVLFYSVYYIFKIITNCTDDGEQWPVCSQMLLIQCVM